jgi:hypothetical protein
MFNTIVGAGAATRYGSGSDQKMRLLAAPAPAPQHWFYCIKIVLILYWTNKKMVIIDCCCVYLYFNGEVQREAGTIASTIYDF